MGLFHKKKQEPSSLPFKSDQLQLIASEFCLEKKELHQFYQCFTSFQTELKSYLTLADMAQTLHHGYPNFAEFPYLQRLFSLISRKTPGKIFFEDYVTGISTFCLMSNQAILRFVFDWFDSDCDDRITIQDILTAVKYINPLTNQQTFFCNFIPDIDRLGKGQPIKFGEFRQYSNSILFIIWPAYELQEKMRELNMGGAFWKKQYQKIQRSQTLLKKSERNSFKIQDKVISLANLKINIEAQYASIHHLQKSRQKGKLNDDMQLLDINRPKRRKSCPYIKGEITSKQLVEEKMD